ncbi:MAG: PEP/pyruvate-binding domain-containing protein [Streptosporangiales bacterium]
MARIADRDQPLAGGKGANLGRLTRAGFPVPPGFVVTTTAYTDFVDAAGLTGCAPAEMHERIGAQEVPERIAAPVLDAYRDLGAPKIAVRSSGTAEDLADASFAGQHDTYLDVEGEQPLLTAVRDCWASLWTPRAVSYRQRYGWDESDLALAVVVQQMVDAEWAGVMFTADPVSGRRDRVVIEAVRGLGEALVSGQATGKQHVADKATGRAVTSGSGLPRGVPEQLVGLGVAVEREFGCPQDIEWTYAEGRCALVQARPLTALPDEPDHTTPAARPRKKRRNYSMAGDHIPLPPFPMDTALFFRPTLRTIFGALRSAGFSTPDPEDTLVEIDEGVVQLIPPRVRATRRAMLRLPAALPTVARWLRTNTDGWRARSEATLLAPARRVDTEDLGALSDDELVARIDGLIHTLGALMPSRFGAVPRGMLSEQAAKLLLRLAVGADREVRLHTELMASVPCVTTRSNAELDRLTVTVREIPELRDAYREEEPAHVAERLGESDAGRAFLADVDAYLAVYGFREMSIFTVGLPPLRETPEVVHRLIKGRVQHDRDDAHTGSDRFTRARAKLFADDHLRARLLAPLIGRLVDTARDSVGFREDSHYQIVMVLAVVRRVVLELGHRLVQRGALDEPDDVAYLDLAEVQGLEPAAAKATVARRKQARAAALDHYTFLPAELMAQEGTDGGVRGTPASRGTAVGPVRVVRDESRFAHLRDGEVLVCPYTNPTWTPLFSLASAVVADTGGAASHAAIVAREHGIPAVMGTGNGTRTLTDGQRVIVDGDAGTVVPLGERAIGTGQ